MNSPLLKKALPHIIAIAIFLIVAIVYCKPALDGKVVYQSDVISWKAMAQQSFEYKEKYGHFPLWIKSGFSGMPSYTVAMDPSTKISSGYLGYLVTWNLPKPINFFFLACVCFYILTQVMGIGSWVGVISSLAYGYATFNPIIIAVGHETQMMAIGYAPAVIAGLVLIFQKKYLFGAAVLSTFFGLQFGTQHVQIAYYTAIVMGLMTVARFLQARKAGDLRSFFIAVAIAAGAGALGVGTYAVGMVPLQEYAKETMRGGKSDITTPASDKNKTKGGLNKDYAFDWSYGIGETFTLIVPGAYGGGGDGKLITSNSKFADKASEIGMPEDAALQFVNSYSYWGPQPSTAGPVYFGAVVLFVFIVGLVFVKSWHKSWLIAAAIVGIVLAWGKNFSTFNYLMFDYFPFYSKFRAPTQALFMAQVGILLLAALALDQVIRDTTTVAERWKKFKTSLYITGGVLIVLMALYFSSDFKSPRDARLKESLTGQLLQSAGRGKQPTPEMQQQASQMGNSLIKGMQDDRQSIMGSDLIRTIILIGIAAALVGLFLRDKIKKEILIGGILLVSSFDLLAEGKKYLNDDNFVDPSDYESAFAPTPADAQISKDPEKNFRVFDEASENGWYQDAKVSYRHNSLGGYSPAKLGLYQDIIENQLGKGNMMVFNMLNTKYFIQRNPANGQSEANLNPGAFGPCWLVKNVHFVKDGNDEMKALDSINVRDTAIVQQKFEKLIPAQPQYDSAASIKMIEDLYEKISYRFSAKSSQFAVFSEVYYDKGWNVYVDGVKKDYCRVDYILRGMSLEAGDHTIEFRFEPASYKLGNTITIICSLAVYLLVIAAIVAEWRKKPGTV